MDRKHEKLKRTPGLRTSAFNSSMVLENPVRPSSSASKFGKQTPKPASTPRTSLTGRTALPIDASLAVKSPSFRVSQMAKVKAETQKMSSSKDLGDHNEIMKTNIATSKKPSDSESSSGSSASPSPKRLKSQSQPLPKSIANASTVASRNQFPPELTNPDSAFHRSSTPRGNQYPTPRNSHSSARRNQEFSLPHNHQLVPRTPHVDAGNKNLKAIARTATSETPTDPIYPASVLKAAHALESILPPYLISSNPQAELSNSDARKTNKPLRPRAGSDDSTRLTTLLESARNLIVHLSTKKVAEGGDKSLMLQAELLRILQQREATIRLLQAEARRWRIVAGR
ncbi:hypothetical protein DV738_g1936, partial [Chaetothyriales sp. CBS 135597]